MGLGIEPESFLCEQLNFLSSFPSSPPEPDTPPPSPLLGSAQTVAALPKGVRIDGHGAGTFLVRDVCWESFRLGCSRVLTHRSRRLCTLCPLGAHSAPQDHVL